MTKPKRWFWFALPLWLLACGLALQVGMTYQFAPGRSADAPPRWPSASCIPLDPKRPTLVITCHPGCPCTQATLTELERLEARHPGEFSANMLILDCGEPTWSVPSWMKIWPDVKRQESDRFGSWTSGQIFLYGPDGKLRFSGGITAGRGHEGENPGLVQLTAALQGAPASTAPVYGCSLGSATPECCRK